MCTDAYREALIRDFSAKTSPAPGSVPTQGQRGAVTPSESDQQQPAAGVITLRSHAELGPRPQPD
jgi:hypothetical protein